MERPQKTTSSCRIIVHFVGVRKHAKTILFLKSVLTHMPKDYDCFYAAVFEKEDPALKSLPLAVQQKQIIVTCNYEARRQGLYKLQLVQEARLMCPDVVVMLGEDLTRFRNASKENYDFLRGRLWSDRAERLGFDEVFLDISDMVDYSFDLLNHNNLGTSFFHLDRLDPTQGFLYDAGSICGHTLPSNYNSPIYGSEAPEASEDIIGRLCLGSHLANYIRKQLEEHQGFSSTVGISTSKLTAKLVGNVNKPRGQTTLLPSALDSFIGSHDIGSIPGIGFKVAQKIREYILGRPAIFDSGLVYGGSKENVKVEDVRTFDGISPQLLEHMLHGLGGPKDLPQKVWNYINGIDKSEVAKGRDVPQQISIEDSYMRLDEISHVEKELRMLARSLVKRMRLDLYSRSFDGGRSPTTSIRWLAYPQNLRLSTRSRLPLRADGTRPRSFARISKSCAMPSFVFNLSTSVEEICERLLTDALMPLFRGLHPERSGWNLSLINICATNMTLTASQDGQMGAGRDISRMFQRQDEILREWKLEDDTAPTGSKLNPSMDSNTHLIESRCPSRISQEDEHTSWDDNAEGDVCKLCGSVMPVFAADAHARFHAATDSGLGRDARLNMDFN